MSVKIIHVLVQTSTRSAAVNHVYDFLCHGRETCRCADAVIACSEIFGEYFILLLVFIVNIEDVVESDASIMSIIGGCLDTCSLVSVSPTEAMNVLRAQVL